MLKKGAEAITSDDIRLQSYQTISNNDKAMYMPDLLAELIDCHDQAEVGKFIINCLRDPTIDAAECLEEMAEEDEKFLLALRELFTEPGKDLNQEEKIKLAEYCLLIWLIYDPKKRFSLFPNPAGVTVILKR